MMYWTYARGKRVEGMQKFTVDYRWNMTRGFDSHITLIICWKQRVYQWKVVECMKQKI